MYDTATDLDEEVTLEGTPLHEYLGELSNTELLYVDDKIGEPNKKLENCEKNFFYGITLKGYVCAKWNDLRNRLSSFFPISQDILIQLSKNYYTEYGKEILESVVILEEDLDYLCVETPQQFLNAFQNNSIKHKVADTMNSARYSMLVAAFTGCVLSILCSPVLPSFMQTCVLLSAFFVLCFNIRLEIVFEMWKRQHELNLKALRNFLSSSKHFDRLTRKSIKLIQEIEVVSRGYKLLNGRTPIDRLEAQANDRKRTLRKLRIAVLRASARCFLACRDSTRRLVAYSPTLDPRADDVGVEQRLLCRAPLGELGLAFLENLDSSPIEAYTATDGYSLASLKRLNELMSKQRSEMLTHLSLTLSKATWDFTEKGFLCNLPGIISFPTQETISSHSTLRCSFEMHKYFTASNQNKTKRPSKGGSGKPTALSINLHSLQVYLRAAMHEVMRLENDVAQHKKIPPDRQSTINMHLSSSAESWDHCEEQILLMGGGGEIKEDKGCEDQARVSGWKINKEERVEVMSLEDSVDYMGEDQIFEAVTNERSSDTEDATRDTEDIATQEEAQKKAKNIQSVTVMRELRSVLAIKTSEEEREQWKRKLFPARAGRRNKDEDQKMRSAPSKGIEPNVDPTVGASDSTETKPNGAFVKISLTTNAGTELKGNDSESTTSRGIEQDANPTISDLTEMKPNGTLVKINPDTNAGADLKGSDSESTIRPDHKPNANVMNGHSAVHLPLTTKQFPTCKTSVSSRSQSNVNQRNNQKNKETCNTANLNGRISLDCKTENSSDYETYPSATQTHLTHLKRAPGPGRPPSATHRRKPMHDVITDAQNCKQTGASEDKALENEEGDTEWTKGLGIGFTNSLAAQAASMARIRRAPRPGAFLMAEAETLTFGSSDSDSS